MRRGNWKAVRPKFDGALELYDLAADPAETRDLAAEKPELTAEFEKRLRAEHVDPRPQKERPHPWWDARS